MEKKTIIVILIGIVIVAAAAFYLVLPAFITIEADEPFPIKDALDTMPTEMKAEFDAEVEKASENIIELDDIVAPRTKVVSQGDFKPRAHEVGGKAILISQGNIKILRFEDFETINGPNLHIYLSSELGDEDFIDLGKIKATKGNVNYELPDDIDLEKYNKVLVWCVPFRVLFSYAKLE